MIINQLRNEILWITPGKLESAKEMQKKKDMERPFPMLADIIDYRLTNIL